MSDIDSFNASDRIENLPKEPKPLSERKWLSLVGGVAVIGLAGAGGAVGANLIDMGPDKRSIAADAVLAYIGLPELRVHSSATEVAVPCKDDAKQEYSFYYNTDNNYQEHSVKIGRASVMIAADGQQAREKQEQSTYSLTDLSTRNEFLAEAAKFCPNQPQSTNTTSTTRPMPTTTVLIG